jgi:hypothetical protein
VRLLADYADSLTSRSALKRARPALALTWALLGSPGADPRVRLDLRSRALAARAPLVADTRLVPLWDPVPVCAAAFAPLLGGTAGVSYPVLRRAAVVAVKCSSALARHVDAAALTGELVALDRDRREIRCPAPGDLAECEALKLVADRPDKASAMAGRAVRAEFLVLRGADPASCPVRAILRYVASAEYRRRRDSAAADRLLYAVNPLRGTFRGISSDSVKRDLRSVLASLGITDRRAAALARAAAANSLLAAGLTDFQVRALGRWTPGSTAFEKFYYKLGLRDLRDLRDRRERAEESSTDGAP